MDYFIQRTLTAFSFVGSCIVALFLTRSLRRRANARNVSFRKSLPWPIHIINPVDKTKLS